jgi:hypothetical protein
MRSWRILFTAIAVVLFCVAIHFGSESPLPAPNAGGLAPNWVAGLTALGFIFAGCVSLVCATFVKEKS